MTGRKLPYAVLVALLLVVALKEAGGSDTATRVSRTDRWGDPFVSHGRLAAVGVGMTENEMFRRLGGEGSSGFYTNGPDGSNSVPGPRGLILLYEYPVRGRRNSGSDTPLHDQTTWWRICVQDGKVVGKRRLGRSVRSVGCWS
jgi:hypothetical protein